MKPSDIIRIKELLPTTLGSEEIRDLTRRHISREAMFRHKTARALLPSDQDILTTASRAMLSEITRAVRKAS